MSINKIIVGVGAGLSTIAIAKMHTKIKSLKEELVKTNMKATKSDEIIKEQEKHTNLILALTALGISMAIVDGNIVEEETITINEFVGGLSHDAYPTHIKKQIQKLMDNPPTFNEAMKYLENVEIIEYQDIRNLLVMTMEADGKIRDEEKAFLQVFDDKVKELQIKSK